MNFCVSPVMKCGTVLLKEVNTCNSLDFMHPGGPSCPPNFYAGYTIGFIERLLRATQKVLGSCMWLSEKWYKQCGIC